MRFGSVCSGIEAASVAFEPLGWSAAWLAEIEPFPSAVLTHHYTCQYCGARGVPLECDHVFPISKGGSNEDDNLVAACVPCNRSKGAKTPEQWRGE